MKALVRAALAVLLSVCVAAAPNDAWFFSGVRPEGSRERIATALPEARHITAADALGTGAFEVVLDVSPNIIARAFLVYELAGVAHWTAAVRSINGLPASGGFGAVPSPGTLLQVEEIDPRWLQPGVNRVVFLPAPVAERAPSRVTNVHRSAAFAQAAARATVPYRVRNLRLVYLDGPRQAAPALSLSHPLQGENDAAGTVLRGFVDPPGLPSGPAELFVDEVYLPQGIHQADGSFAAFVPRTAPAGEAWETRIEVVYPDGSRLRRTVRLSGENADENSGDDEDDAEVEADPGSDESVSVGKARLRVGPDALRGQVKLTMRKLRREDLPAMDAGMTNVTPLAGGYRLGPHGLRFKTAVELTLPYDAALIPRGMTADDIRTFYFDEAAGRWFAVPRLQANAGESVVVSATDHFTDFVNATLALPDEPGGANFTSNSLQELAQADPASQVHQIEPPEGGPDGDAVLGFPIVVPPGRQGMQPHLAVQYDSSAGNGWLGVGWNLGLSNIQISTAFGVPRYNGDERYLLDGEHLVATGAGRYVRRVEGSFDRIVRHGTNPTDYWWEVTDKNGTRSIYGRSTAARLRDPQPGQEKTFRWLLEQEVDLHGNTVQYSYVTDSGGGNGDGERWVEVYPAQIDYTAGPGVGAFYHVVFTLDDGKRLDRLSSGLQGFKTYTRKRLAKVEVKAGAEVVRQYDFEYVAGSFSKSLLASVAVKGKGGAEFYAHKFAYHQMPEAAGGYDGFADEQAWNGIESSADFTDTFRVGGGAHAFVGLGPTSCQPHAGVQVGGSVTDTTQRVTFVDVNGDGLPDRLDEGGKLHRNTYDPVANASSGSFVRAPDFGAVGKLGHTLEWTLDVGVGAHVELGVTAKIDGTFVWAHANDDRLLTDVNGDFRPDLVSAGSNLSVRLNKGTHFESAPWTGFSGTGLNLARADEESEVLEKFHLSDAVRQLAMPWAGRVTVSGAIEKKEPTGDGVGVAIYRNHTRIWKRTFAANDTAPCVPGPGDSCGGGLSADVQPGDSLYFLASSLKETTGDALRWAPVVTYDGADANALEPYGARTFVFDADKDFRLAGYRGASWTAPASGAIRISGALVKQETSNAVVVTVVRQRYEGKELVLDETLLTHTFEAGQQTTFDTFPTLNVEQGDLLFLRVSSLMTVDPSRVAWTPAVTYDGATEPALPPEERSTAAQVGYMPPDLVQMSGPTRAWTAPSTGEHTFGIVCPFPQGNQLFVQGVNRLITVRDFATGAFTVTASAGDRLFFNSVGHPGQCVVNGDPLFPVNVFAAPPPDLSFPFDPKKKEAPLSGGYHGWYYGDWNGDVPFHTSGLIPPEDEDDDDPLYTPGAPHWEGFDGIIKPLWTGGGFDLHITAGEVKPSRKGANVVEILAQASGTSGGGLSVLRKNTGKTVSVGASAGAGGGTGGGVSASWGWNDTELDLLDMNGDRYPDQVSGSGVRFSNGETGFGGLTSFPGLDSVVRATQDITASTTAGLGVSFNRKNGEGKPSAVQATLPSFGNSVSLTQTTDDLIDVNGDGLPDRLEMSPGGKTVAVYLNLGYRFGAKETWELPHWKPGPSRCGDAVDYVASELAGHSELDTLNGISFTRSSALQVGAAVGPIGGDVSTTLARTLVELIDINGDGLADRVAKEDGEDFFNVQLNLGDRWGEEQRWRVPEWDASIGSGYDPGVFKCHDAVTFSGDVQVDGSVGAPFCIPLVFVGIQIELSGQVFGTTSAGLQLMLEDIDGDGLADHILKKSKNGNVYVKRNKAAMVNLLTRVERPLGSTIEIAYARRGNHLGNPFSQWVLSEVTLRESHSGAAYKTAYAYDNDAFYDRAERESYGYGHLRVTMPDQSTIDRYFSNDDFYTRHLQTRQELRDKDQKLFVVETATFKEKPDGPGSSWFPALVAETTSFHEGTPAAKTTSRVYQHDAQGNVTLTLDYGEEGTAEDDVRTEVAYQIDDAKWVTRPVSVTVFGGTAGEPLRKRQASYTNAFELERLEQQLKGGRDPESGASYSGTKNAVWTFRYDEAGNLTESADPAGFKSTITYDETTRTYPTHVVDSFGYVTRFGYALEFGALAETTDQNGQVIRRAYDPFGRLLRVAGPYDSDQAPALSFEYRLGNPVSSAVTRQKDVTRSDTIDSAVFVDSLERVIQSKRDAEIETARTGMVVSGVLKFDVKGRVASQGQPGFDDSGTPHELVAVAAKNPTTFTYDVLDRVRTVAFPQGTATSVKYTLAPLNNVQRFLTVRTDPRGRETSLYRDLEGNTIAVVQSNTIGGTKKSITTRYTYDPLDQLTAVTDDKGSTTRIEYDSLGRQVVLDNPDLGRTESRYDPAGNLRSKITANLAAAGQQIRYHYTFHRLDRIDYPQSPDVTFTYGGPGAPFHRANRIASVTDASGLEERSYGKLGEIVETRKTMSALNGNTPKGPYTTKFHFDSFNRLLSLVYPDGETLTYGYDAGGQVKSATGVLKGVRFDYLRHLGYDEFGAPSRKVAGNGAETRYTYDPKSRFLTRLQTTAGGRALQNLVYEHDRTGTIEKITNDVPVPAASLYGGPATQTFRYDELYQLVGAEGTYQPAPNKTSTYSLALAYDSVGNTVSKNQLHQTGNAGKPNVEKKTSYNWTYTYGSRQPHAPSRIGERTFRYDLNGNQTGWETDANGTRRTLTWDEENRLAAVADNGQTTRFLYDTQGTRSNKAGPHGETIYVNPWFTLRNGAIASKHVFADAVRIATKVSPDPNPPSEKVYFFQADHLGSTQFVTDETAAVFQHLEYFPSGEAWVDERSETQRTPYLFSGKELDEETSLSYFGHRYYDARQGQWISADPILDEMLDARQFGSASLSAEPFHLPGNLYGYVNNDPINRFDPNGLSGEGKGGNTKNPRKRKHSSSDSSSSSASSGPAPVRASPRKKQKPAELLQDDLKRVLGTWSYPIGGSSVAAGGGTGKYDVSAEVYVKGRKTPFKGQYSAVTGEHAEMVALGKALVKHQLTDITRIRVTKGCCRRCAAVMTFFQVQGLVGPDTSSPTSDSTLPTGVADTIRNKWTARGLPGTADNFIHFVQTGKWW